MFGFLKKKSKVEKLEAQYQQLLKEAYDLSQSSRIKSDMKYAEAQGILEEINKLSEQN